MPDYQFNTNLGPAQQQGTSLADLIGTARGVQAYQQAEQLNPLAVQKAQMEVEQAKKLNPLNVRKAEEEVSQAETATKKGKLGLTQDQTKIINDNIGSVLNDERLIDPNPQRRAVPLIEARQRVINGGVDPVLAEVMFAPLLDKAMRDKNPTAVKDMMSSISNIQQSGIGATGQQAIQSGSVIKLNGIDYKYNAATGKYQEIQPQNQPKAPTVAPTENVQVGNQGQAKVTPQTSSESLVQIDMPMRGVQMNTQQADRYKIGETDFANANERQKIAKDSALASQQIKRSLKEAAGSKPGQIIRQAGKTFFGNTELDTLVKNLAEQQIRQAKLMGVSSVNAEQDLKTANGSENITAEALAHIVDRAEAMNLAAEKYNQALTKMQTKYGKQNAYIHNDNFQRAWANNYDPVAFLIQNINASNIPKKEKDKAIDYYTEGMSQKQLDELAVKMKNLKRLERGDF